jgi:hypothetical protein
MIGRREFSITGISALALAALEGSAFGQAPAAEKGAAAGAAHGKHDTMMQACAKACSDCQRACDMCSTHCAQKLVDGNKDHMTTLGTCRDCADFCATAAQIVARSGPFSAEICKGCAEACARCAAECEKFPDDAHMKACAAECRKCEKACREMVAHAAHAHG